MMENLQAPPARWQRMFLGVFGIEGLSYALVIGAMARGWLHFTLSWHWALPLLVLGALYLQLASGHLWARWALLAYHLVLLLLGPWILVFHTYYLALSQADAILAFVRLPFSAVVVWLLFAKTPARQYYLQQNYRRRQGVFED